MRVATDLARPVFATAPPADHERLFVVEQHSGKIKIYFRSSGTLDHDSPFLTIGNLAKGQEQGLLGLAFHPDYASNRRFYTNRTRSDGASVIEEYQVSANPNVAATPRTRRLLVIAQPQSTHNGGWLGFGPDGYLYIAVGDGGGRDDAGTGHTPDTGNAQDTTKLLGKILRIDVDATGSTTPYAIPASNPFVGTGAREEIWAYGLRHPWRPSFDRLTGDLYIADVGQNTIEEVNFQPANSAGGENYGWRLREGTTATPTGGVGGSQPSGGINPIFDYPHSSTQFAVTGGYVHRGSVADLQGSYVFGDLSARIWALDFDGSDPSEFDGTNFSNFRELTAQLAPQQGEIENLASFGEDADGNLYIVDLGSTRNPGTSDGELFLIVPEPGSAWLQLAALGALLVRLRLRR